MTYLCFSVSGDWDSNAITSPFVYEFFTRLLSQRH